MAIIILIIWLFYLFISLLIIVISSYHLSPSILHFRLHFPSQTLLLRPLALSKSNQSFHSRKPFPGSFITHNMRDLLRLGQSCLAIVAVACNPFPRTTRVNTNSSDTDRPGRISDTQLEVAVVGIAVALMLHMGN